MTDREMNRKGNAVGLASMIMIAIIIIVSVILNSCKSNTVQEQHIYPDEDVMWITGNGDTIWE